MSRWTSRVLGVRSALEGERNALGPAYLRHLGVEGQGPFPASELGGAVLLAVHTLLGHPRVQLERLPSHSHICTPGEGGYSLLQSPLADVAPRADHIGDHFDNPGHGFPPWYMIGYQGA